MINKDDYKISSDGKTLVRWKNHIIEHLDMNDEQFPKIQKIGDGAFSDVRQLKSVIISKNITEIGCKAFSGCSSLVSIEIPEKIDEIREETFMGCTYLP